MKFVEEIKVTLLKRKGECDLCSKEKQYLAKVKEPMSRYHLLLCPACFNERGYKAVDFKKGKIRRLAQYDFKQKRGTK